MIYLEGIREFEGGGVEIWTQGTGGIFSNVLIDTG